MRVRRLGLRGGLRHLPTVPCGCEYTSGCRVRFYEDVPCTFLPRSLATALKEETGWSGPEFELEEERLARKATRSATTTHRCLTCLATTFG